jgi:hypothetical protein
MLDQALGDDRRHELVGAVDALAASGGKGFMVVFEKLSEQPGFSAEEHRKIGRDAFSAALQADAMWARSKACQSGIPAASRRDSKSSGVTGSYATACRQQSSAVATSS